MQKYDTDAYQSQRLKLLSQSVKAGIVNELNSNGFALEDDYHDIDRIMCNNWGDLCKAAIHQLGANSNNVKSVGHYCDQGCGARYLIFDPEKISIQEALDKLKSTDIHPQS